MKFQLFDIGVTTPSDWRIRVTERSTYQSGRMAIISPKKLYLAIQWRPFDSLKMEKSEKGEGTFSLQEYLNEVFGQTKDRRIKDLKVLENTGHYEGDHEFRFIRVTFTYKKFLNPPKPQHYIGYLILCKKLNRLIGAFTNYPVEAVDEDVSYLEGPLRSVVCLCSK
ncbi:MAG: hypothetical protein HA492_07565 [Candidatus Verstraetearchaeota archaeon]|jgi:hypothetical protein|nr:hypothetical protein [Candidatus Methanomethylicia archaeon]NHV61233.1 hypothetical protein [Candidatus Verstraetearchaeota archaeon]